MLRSVRGHPPRTCVGAYLLEWFSELDAVRITDAMGNPRPITYTEIDSWARRTGRELLPWECRLLRTLDDAMRDHLLSRGRSDGATVEKFDRLFVRD